MNRVHTCYISYQNLNLQFIWGTSCKYRLFGGPSSCLYFPSPAQRFPLFHLAFVFPLQNPNLASLINRKRQFQLLVHHWGTREHSLRCRLEVSRSCSPFISPPLHFCSASTVSTKCIFLFRCFSFFWYLE